MDFSELSDTELARRSVKARQAVNAAFNALQQAEQDLDDCRAETDERVKSAHSDGAECHGCSACDCHYALTWRVSEAVDFVRHLPA